MYIYVYISSAVYTLPGLVFREYSSSKARQRLHRTRTGRLAFLLFFRHNGGLLRAPLAALSAIECCEGFEGVFSIGCTWLFERRQSLGQLYVWSVLFFRSEKHISRTTAPSRCHGARLIGHPETPREQVYNVPKGLRGSLTAGPPYSRETCASRTKEKKKSPSPGWRDCSVITMQKKNLFITKRKIFDQQKNQQVFFTRVIALLVNCHIWDSLRGKKEEKGRKKAR